MRKVFKYLLFAIVITFSVLFIASVTFPSDYSYYDESADTAPKIYDSAFPEMGGCDLDICLGIKTNTKCDNYGNCNAMCGGASYNNCNGWNITERFK